MPDTTEHGLTPVVYSNSVAASRARFEDARRAMLEAWRELCSLTESAEIGNEIEATREALRGVRELIERDAREVAR